MKRSLFQTTNRSGGIITVQTIEHQKIRLDVIEEGQRVILLQPFFLTLISPQRSLLKWKKTTVKSSENRRLEVMADLQLSQHVCSIPTQSLESSEHQIKIGRASCRERV